MPQEIRVVKCFKCQLYQSDIVKKAKKWQCKMCGEKQSVFVEYGRGSGKECRIIVQELNGKQKYTDDATINLLNEVRNNILSGTEEADVKPVEDEKFIEETENNRCTFTSKWSLFVETADSEVQDADDKQDLFCFESSTGFTSRDRSTTKKLKNKQSMKSDTNNSRILKKTNYRDKTTYDRQTELKDEDRNNFRKASNKWEMLVETQTINQNHQNSATHISESLIERNNLSSKRPYTGDDTENSTLKKCKHEYNSGRQNHGVLLNFDYKKDMRTTSSLLTSQEENSKSRFTASKDSHQVDKSSKWSKFLPDPDESN